MQKGKGLTEVKCSLSIMEHWPLHQIKLVDITKITISLCKAKPEWLSLSDFCQVIFAYVYWTPWNLHIIHNIYIYISKTILFYFYFMSILMLSHLFLYYFILSDLYFIPILPDRENRSTILFVFYFYFKPILKQD